MNKKLRTADFLVQTLLQLGTSHIFSLSGNQIMPIYDALIGPYLIHVAFIASEPPFRRGRRSKEAEQCIRVCVCPFRACCEDVRSEDIDTRSGNMLVKVENEGKGGGGKSP